MRLSPTSALPLQEHDHKCGRQVTAPSPRSLTRFGYVRRRSAVEKIDDCQPNIRGNGDARNDERGERLEQLACRFPLIFAQGCLGPRSSGPVAKRRELVSRTACDVEARYL